MKLLQLLLLPLMAGLVLAFLPTWAFAQRLSGQPLRLYDEVLSLRKERDTARAELEHERERSALDLEEAAQALMRERQARQACEDRPPHVPAWVLPVGVSSFAALVATVLLVASR